MRTLLAALTALMLFATPVVAGPYDHLIIYGQGSAAYDAGDFQQAFRLWNPLAEQGHAEAQFNIGGMYEDGKGVPKNFVKAREWYLKAVTNPERPHVRALAAAAIGTMYAKGRGVGQSDIDAYAWWSTATHFYSSVGASERDKLATYMSERDLAKAKKLEGDYWKMYVLD